METRFFEGISREISLLGFGLMRLHGDGARSAFRDKAEAIAMVDAALESGVNYFDTAYMYMEGASEHFVAESLGRHPRDSYNLATKMPLMFLEDKTKAEVPAIFEEQLRRCGVEHFDFYLAHNLSAGHRDSFRRCEVYEFMQRMKEQGKIRRVGFSFHDTPEVLREVLEEHAWDFVQIQLNYLDWDLQRAGELYEILSAKGIPVSIMEPVRGGALADLGPDANAVFRQADPQASIPSWALRFAASLPGVMTVLSGMSNMEQMQDNLSTFSSFCPLDEAEREVIRRALQAFQATAQIPCTGCRYCMDCPSGVDIPRLFAAYNHYKLSGNAMGFRTTYRLMGEKAQPGSCVACGACSAQCPQGLDIPALLREVGAEAQKQLAARP